MAQRVNHRLPGSHIAPNRPTRMPDAATASDCDRICIPTIGNLHTYGQNVKGIQELQYFYKVRTVHTPGMSCEEQTVDPRRRRRTQRRPSGSARGRRENVSGAGSRHRRRSARRQFENAFGPFSPGRCVALVIEVWWSGVEHAKDTRAPVGALTRCSGRRAVRVDGGQGPRVAGVHRPARGAAAKLRLAGAGVPGQP